LVALPLSEATYLSGALFEPCGVLEILHTVCAALLGHAPVGRGSLGVGGSEHDHDAHRLLRRLSQLSAKVCGSIDDSGGGYC
jgi:hypothetical protein